MSKKMIPKKIDYTSQNRRAVRSIIVATFVLMTGILSITGVTYALFSTSKEGTSQTVVAGVLTTTFTEGQVFRLSNAYPMTDAQGIALTPYTFSVQHTGNIEAVYQVKLEPATTNTLPTNKIKFSLQKPNGTWTTPALLSTLTNSTLLEDNQPLAPQAVINYGLKMWVDESAGNEVQGLVYQAKVVVEVVQSPEIN